jgi:glycosyltransferase involved in cell wall biosynthesis
MMMNLVIHDYFESLEGGGKLCSILAEELPAALAYGFAKAYHPFLTLDGSFICAQEMIDGFKEIVSWNNNRFVIRYNLDAFSSLPLWRQFKLAYTFAHKATFLKKYHNVIYSGFYAPLAIHHHLSGNNILFCHTPPRFIYDQRDFYFSQVPFGLRFLLSGFIRYLQPRYEAAVDEMNVVIANSEHVRQRIQHFLGKDAVVVYPPCDIKRFVWVGQGDYFLSVGRLDPLKRVDFIVKAFLNMPDKRLIVTSGGEDFFKLRRLAKNASHISFTHWVDEQELAYLVGNAIAIIYVPKDEDFGMSAVESMAAGKPVIGVAEGGLLETVIPGETGWLIDSPLKVENLISLVDSITLDEALKMRKTCEEQARRFDKRLFLKNIREFL